MTSKNRITILEKQVDFLLQLNAMILNSFIAPTVKSRLKDDDDFRVLEDLQKQLNDTIAELRNLIK